MNGTRSPPKIAQSEQAPRRIIVKATLPQHPQQQMTVANDVAPRSKLTLKAPSYLSIHSADAQGSLGPPRKILSNVPSSVTTRRPISPTRPTIVSQPSSQSASHDAKATKPAFFTASSYSAPRAAKSVLPEIKRADSASILPTSHKTSRASRSNSPDLFRQVDSPTPYTSHSVMLVRPGLRETHSEDLLARRRLSSEVMPSLQPKTEYAEKRTSRGSTLSSAGSAVAADTASGMYHKRTRAPSLASPAPSNGLAHQSPEFVDLHEPDTLQSSAAAESSTRRMLDYEIRNTSLMTINAHLEKQTRRQAVELKQLRRHAQDARAGMIKPLSPDASEALTSDDDVPDVVGSRKTNLSDEVTGTIRSLDGSIQRALLISEQLLTDAQRGLAYRPRESEIGLGVRVLQQGDEEDEREDDDDG